MVCGRCGTPLQGVSRAGKGLLPPLPRRGRWRWWLALGVLAGLSITTKYSAVLLPLELVVVGWLAFRIANVNGQTGPPLAARAMAARVLLAGLAYGGYEGYQRYVAPTDASQASGGRRAPDRREFPGWPAPAIAG